MTTCAHPRCSSTARWRCRDGQSRCSDHAVDFSPLTPLPDDTILAARCPRGWRRDPLTGRPVMPCLGRLLFPCEPHEVPTACEIHQQCRAIFGDFTTPCMVRSLICVVEVLLVNAARAKQDHGRCLDMLDDHIVCNAVDNVLRSQSTVRLRRVAGGWEEVADAAAEVSNKEDSQ